jgi:hypothetical protein
LTCSAGSHLSVKYNGPASHAEVETWWTTFDNQNPNPRPGLEKQVVKIGDSVPRTFAACQQGDAAQPGVKEIGGCFFDKDQKPFTPSRNPEKVTECRTTPCNPEARESWIEDEEYKDGEWSTCSPDNQPPTSVATSQQCFKKKTRTWTSVNVCTKQTRTRTDWVYAECECPCVEPKEVREIPSTVYWNTAILEGKCNPEVLPLVGIDEATITPSLNCHTTGQQRINLDYQCSADSFRTRDLCKNVACPTPPPTCDNTPASYKGNANGGLFNLQNSGDAAELAWVNANVLVGPWEKFASEGEKDDDCFTSDHAAKVVIVKAGSEQSATWSYRTYLNVTAGQQLCSYSVAHKDVSHATYFRCD